MKLILLILLFTQASFAQEFIEIISGVTAKIEKKFPQAIAANEFEEDRYILSVDLGFLNHDQFIEIRKLHKNSSEVEYDPKRKYQITDFLPPFAQAVSDKLFPPIIYNYDSDLLDRFDQAWPLVKNGAEISSNCWNTSIKFLVSMFSLSNYEVSIYIADMNDVSTLFNNNSQLINESDIKAGDVLVVSETDDDSVGSTIQHTAVIIGPNLVFEKTAPDENAPYRVSFLSDIKNKFKKLMTDPDWLIPKVTFTYHRFDKNQIIRPSLNSLGHLYGDPMSTGLKEELLIRQPSVRPENMIQTCFPGLGGGCDPFISVLNSFTLEKDLYGRYKLPADKNTFLDL